MQASVLCLVNHQILALILCNKFQLPKLSDINHANHVIKQESLSGFSLAVFASAYQAHYLFRAYTFSQMATFPPPVDRSIWPIADRFGKHPVLRYVLWIPV